MDAAATTNNFLPLEVFEKVSTFSEVSNIETSGPSGKGRRNILSIYSCQFLGPQMYSLNIFDL